MTGYTFQRVDTATHVRREALLALAPGWGAIATDRPQFALFEPDGSLADWHLMGSFEEARATCAKFNAGHGDDDGGARSEAVWQARMAGDLSQ